MLTGVNETPGAREIAANLITLPTHLAVSEKTATRIATKVQEDFPA
jgi:dTDP-4-amino-4,6-dideoxygalactose transaminase